MKEEKPNIVVIGGGTGVFTVLSGLRTYPIDLTAVISMADDGGSTGVLREEFGVLPPGDVRRALVAMSHSDNRLLSDLFNYRFETGGLKGHTFGNIMLTALERVTGSFADAIEESSRVLGVEGRVLPVTLDNVRLLAELEDKTILRGEAAIDARANGHIKIRRVFLDASARLNPKVREAILKADLIVVGPGDLFTSVVPNLLVRGMKEVLKSTRAKKVYVVNLMTKSGETFGFSACDFVSTIEHYIGKNILDYAIINTKRPSQARMAKYEKEGAEFVRFEKMKESPVSVRGEFVRERGFLRHDPDRLARILVSLL